MNPTISRPENLPVFIGKLCLANADLDRAIGKQNESNRFKRRHNNTLDTLCHKIMQDERFVSTGAHKEQIYCKRTPEEEVRVNVSTCAAKDPPANKKNINISYDNETEIEIEATKQS